MAKRPSLAESMKAVAHRPNLEAIIPDAAPSTGFVQEASPSGYRARTREGMKRLTVIVEPAEHRRVKRLSADTGRSMEDLMREAIADLLQKHNA